MIEIKMFHGREKNNFIIAMNILDVVFVYILFSVYSYFYARFGKLRLTV